CFELAHKLCKKCRCCRAEESNREPSDLAPCGSPGSLNSQFSLRERAYRFGIKHLAFGCELCNALRARKQLQAELFFEIQNRLSNLPVAQRGSAETLRDSSSIARLR